MMQPTELSFLRVGYTKTKDLTHTERLEMDRGILSVVLRLMKLPRTNSELMHGNFITGTFRVTNVLVE